MAEGAGLLVSLAVCVPWIVSRLGLTHYWFGQEWMLCLGNGVVAFAWGVRGIGRKFASQTFDRWLLHYDLQGATKTFVVPLWIPLLLAVVTTGVLSWRRYRLVNRAGHCVSCGYDLTGNTSGVCPECGVEIPDLEAVREFNGRK